MFSKDALNYVKRASVHKMFQKARCSARPVAACIRGLVAAILFHVLGQL